MSKFLFAAALIGLSTAAIAQAPAQRGSFETFAAHARDRMMALDTDHDGKISKDEFAARADMMMQRRRGQDAPGAKPHDGARMFDRLDTNRDGYLDPTEINALLAKRFARMDANHDGVLTPDERHAMRGHAAPEQ